MLIVWTAVVLAAPRPVDDPMLPVDLAVLHEAAESSLDVVIELEPDMDSDAFVLTLSEQIGAQRVTGAARNLVRVFAGMGELSLIAQMPGVMKVRLPQRPVPLGVLSEGVGTMLSDDWTATGLTGAGVNVAIVDLGFRGYDFLLGEDLPAEVGTTFLGDSWEGEVHGTAVAEIVHDIAPDARMHLYQISDEISYFNEVWPIRGRTARVCGPAGVLR